MADRYIVFEPALGWPNPTDLGLFAKGAPVKSSLIPRIVAGALVATSAFVSTNYLLAQSPAAPAASAPASQGAPAVFAVINGQEISSDKFNQLLVTIAGMRVFEQVLDLVVAEQACLGAGININAPEFQKNMQAELDRALADIKGPEGMVLTDTQRKAALEQYLAQRGITNVEFQMGLRRGACLRALAKDKVTVTDTDVDNAYKFQYGNRLVGHIFGVRTMEQASDIRKALVDQAKSIDEVARTFGGQATVIPMDVDDKSLESLKSACKVLGEKQLSGSIAQNDKDGKVTGYLLFYLERKELPKDVKLDAALKTKLRTNLQEQGERNWANNHLQFLRSKATIKINDPILSKQVEEAFKRMQSNTTQSATAPATAPAPAIMK